MATARGTVGGDDVKEPVGGRGGKPDHGGPCRLHVAHWNDLEATGGRDVDKNDMA